MYIRRTIMLSLLLCVGPCCVVFAQPVHIPDPNLRAAIQDAIGLRGSDITQADMLRLEAFPAEGRGITDLTGLEYALNLKRLLLQGNSVTNLAPLATLTTLEFLFLSGNSITDISPLSSLTRLKRLALDYNRISDVRPLAGLIALKHLTVGHNSISDVNPLAGLYNLTGLEIQANQIADHSPLDALSLNYFIYDQSCETLAAPLSPRLQNRSFPSVFAAFITTIYNRPDLDRIERYWDRRVAQGAQHDLFFSSVDMFDQRFSLINDQWHIRGSMPIALARRDQYFAHNPNMIFLAEIRMRSAGSGHLPPDFPDWVWVKDSAGNFIYSRAKRRLINFTHPKVQDMIVQQAIAVSNCGLYDGIFFDWWTEYYHVLGGHIDIAIEQQARDNIIRRIRAETRSDFLIMVNANRRKIPRNGPNINGSFMETGLPGGADAESIQAGLLEMSNSLLWLEANLKQPLINALEGHALISESPDSATNLQWMRAITTLSLTHSDGYVLFESDGGHGHYWYDFWDTDLGRPVGEKGQLYQDTEGLYIREFTNGWAVYNHSGGAQEITLPEIVTGVASGVEGITHTLPNYDGEMYLRAKPANPADVNGDGIVNILDLILVAQGIGANKTDVDVNGDGVVNVFDLVFVANQF